MLRKLNTSVLLVSVARPSRLWSRDCRLLTRLLTTSVERNAAAADTHQPAKIQSKWYDLWQRTLADLNRQESRPVFSMLFPPPNVTGNLHLGHAITSTIQDSIVRWKIMNGYRAFWIPGYDHAGIATQVVVEKKLWSERKKTRHDLPKEEFIEEIHKWKDEKKGVIREQMIKLNALCDWNYEYFTMDPHVSRAVNEAFIRLHERGLVYRAVRPVNWCSSLKSTISDAEVDSVQVAKRTYLAIPNYAKPVEFGVIYRFAYPLADNPDELIEVATTRPETMFGDTAVAVHPADARYARFHGRRVLNPLTGASMPVIVDESVDAAFQTGAVKITPAHDLNDYQTGLKHKLPFKSILDEAGCLKDVPEEFQKLPRFEARRRVIDRLKELGLFRSSADHAMTLPVCSRSGDVIEPVLKEQWFVDSAAVFRVCGEAVRDGRLQLIAGFRANLWNHYVETYSQRDWCISRQLWWGQQIPAYRCSTPGDSSRGTTWIAAHSREEALAKARAHFKTNDDEVLIQQDEDVFDTWFCSTLLPIAVLGWPETDRPPRRPGQLAFDRVYPTALLETGFDIMFFWAFRMVAMCHALSGQLPFRQILFHGLVRDSQGRKMSKSIGNVIDPIDLIDGASLAELKARIAAASGLSEKEAKLSARNQERTFPNGIEAVGSDAARLGLLVQDFKSDNINIDLSHFSDAKRYLNKIWQAVRYSQMSRPELAGLRKHSLNEIIEGRRYRRIDAWILNRLVATVKYVEESFGVGDRGEYSLHLATKRLREFYYNDFCDFYLECTKPVLKEDVGGADENSDEQLRAQVWNVLRVCNETALVMYHPFIPSLTEELWQRSAEEAGSSILRAEYPRSDRIARIPDSDLNGLDAEIELVRAITSSILSIKQAAAATGERPRVTVRTSSQMKEKIADLSKEIVHLAKLGSLRTTSDAAMTTTTNAANCLSLKLGDECQIEIEFQKPVDRRIIVAKFEKQLDKERSRLKALQEKASKSSESAREKYHQELLDQQSQVSKLEKQIDALRHQQQQQQKHQQDKQQRER